MKIKDVKIHVITPQGRALNTIGDVSRWVFVEIETDEGITGVGEATNSPRRGSEIVGRALQIMRDSLIGKDPSHIEKIWIEMFRNYTYLGNRGLITTAISGVPSAPSPARWLSPIPSPQSPTPIPPARLPVGSAGAPARCAAPTSGPA